MKAIVLLATIAVLVQAQFIGGPGTNIPGCADYCLGPIIGQLGCSDSTCACQNEDTILSRAGSCLDSVCAQGSNEKAQVIAIARAFCTALLANTSSASPTASPTSSLPTSTPAASDATNTASPYGVGSSSSSGLSTGAKAAIGVVIPVVVLALLGLAAFLYRRRRQKAKAQAPIARLSEVDEKDVVTERYAKYSPDDPPPFVELAGQPVSASKGKVEAPGEDLVRSELAASVPGQKALPPTSTAGETSTAAEEKSVLPDHRSGDSIPIAVPVSTYNAEHETALASQPQQQDFDILDEAQAAHALHAGPQGQSKAPLVEEPAARAMEPHDVSPPISPPTSPPPPQSTTAPPPQRAKSMYVPKPEWTGEERSFSDFSV